MTLSIFHTNLLGIHPDRTPVEFRCSDRQKALYSTLSAELRGYFSGPVEDVELFTAIFVAAYKATADGKVFILVDPAVQNWANGQLKLIARRIFSTRKGANRDTIQTLFQRYQDLSMGSKTNGPEPKRWFGYGYSAPGDLPVWVHSKLTYE